MSDVTVVLCAEHRSYREGLARAIRAHAGLRLLAVCADGESALGEIVTRRPAVCLLDIGLRPRGGLWLCRRVRGSLHGESPRVVVMSSDAGASLAAEAQAAGAALLVDKDASRPRLCELLLEVAAAPA